MDNHWKIKEISLSDVPFIGGFIIAATIQKGDRSHVQISEYLDRSGKLVTGLDSMTADGHNNEAFHGNTDVGATMAAMVPAIEKAIERARVDIDHLAVLDVRPNPMFGTGSKIADIRIGKGVRVLGVEMGDLGETIDRKLEFFAGDRALEIVAKVWNGIAEQARAQEFQELIDATPDKIVSPKLAKAIIGAAVVSMATDPGIEISQAIGRGNLAGEFRTILEKADEQLAAAGFTGSVVNHLAAFDAAKNQLQALPGADRPVKAPVATPVPGI